METKSIRQSVIFKASPHEVYEALMDSKKHAKFSGQEARISRTPGGKIRAYGGYIEGVNLDLQADRKIVQSWRGSNWPPGHFSRVTFALRKVRAGTRLEFRQVGVPAEFHKDITQGWKDFYWAPMKAMLEVAGGPGPGRPRTRRSR